MTLFSTALLFIATSLADEIVQVTYDVTDTLAPVIRGNCPNNCNGKGSCQASVDGLCHCYPGYHGVDCSQRLCPSGTAWYDHPSADNIAHADYTECSNMGICDRSTGLCKCRLGFSGPACSIMNCPFATNSVGKNAPCSGNGRCVPLRTISQYVDYEQFSNSTVYDDWDADMIYGCDCNEGWEGVVCSKRSCPRGDNPSTPGMDEVQLIDCECDIASFSCEGTFQLSVRGLKTQSMPLNATEELIKMRIEQLSVVEDVGVNIVNEHFCTKEGSVTSLKFRLPQGDYPAVIVVPGDTFYATTLVLTDGDASVVDPSLVSVQGTREYVECSDHGACDRVTGACECFSGYGPSDGFGSVGTRGDCGYQYSVNVTVDVNGTDVETGCPYVFNGINATRLFCSGHGTCSFFYGTCECDDGWEGAGCQKKSCGTANAWFGSVERKHSANVVCAGVGDCNYLNGVCENCGGAWGLFQGNSCEQLSCYTDASGLECGGNGACLTLREVAALTYGENKELTGVVYETPWDADMIRGCSCYRSWTVDNQYKDGVFPPGHMTESRDDMHYDRRMFYRGPTAFAATDWIGYDCQHASCPTGLDPTLRESRLAVNEIQLLECDADSGYFYLTFRGNTTRKIPWDASGADLELYIEELYTVNDVAIHVMGDDNNISTAKICDNGNTTIEFLSELGDLPLMHINFTDLDHNVNNWAHSYVLNITELQAGTKIDVECSAMGTCDQTTGQCNCLTGYFSSDGTVTSPGERYAIFPHE